MIIECIINKEKNLNILKGYKDLEGKKRKE